MRKVLKSFEEKNINRVALANQVWDYWMECRKEGVGFFISPFSSDERKRVSSVLVERLREEKEGRGIAAVLAICSPIMEYDGPMRASLTGRGLVIPLVEILNSYRDQVDVVVRGLWAAIRVIPSYGEECIDHSREFAIHPFP